MKQYLANTVLALLVMTSNPSFAFLTDVTKIVVTPSTLNGSGWLQISEVIATETGTGNDLALASMGAVASGSSNWPGSSPNYAIDGIAPAGFPSIFHSNENNGSSFLNIELASPSELDSITLYGRTNCCSYRDIFNIALFNSIGDLLFEASDLNATGSSHSVSLTLPDAAANVPEPTTLALMALGIAGFGFTRKKCLKLIIL
jgi:hypothetical protein